VEPLPAVVAPYAVAFEERKTTPINDIAARKTTNVLRLTSRIRLILLSLFLRCCFHTRSPEGYLRAEQTIRLLRMSEFSGKTYYCLRILKGSIEPG